MISRSKKKCDFFLVTLIVFFLILAFKTARAVESQEIPILQLSLNEIKDIPVQNFRNVIVTTPNVIETKSLPNNIFRITAKGPGTTLIYLWDSTGRKTIQINVSNFTADEIPNFRPGYNPQGTEFTYHTGLTNQIANGEVVSPFWLHDFSASIPIRKKNEWRTMLSAITNPNGFNNNLDYRPFSRSTYPSQLLSYYRTSTFTAAVGDVNYNPGELSITSFPLRGGAVEFYNNGGQDQLKFFGGLSRPRVRSDYFFNDPKDHLVGFSGSKEIWPNIILKSSFVYLDQPTFATPFTGLPTATTGQTFKNDYVADLGIQTHPLTDEWTLEGEIGKSSNDLAFLGLAEYAPYWGRVMVSYKQLGENYVTPANFFLLKNYRQGDFITDYKISKKLGLSLNYQFSEFGSDPVLSSEKTTVNRIALSDIYQKNEAASYVSTVTLTKSSSVSSPQISERLDTTYQRTYKDSGDLLYAQVFQQYFKNDYLTQSTRRIGGGTDVRYTRKFSSDLSLEVQTAFQMNHVKNTFVTTSGSLQNYFDSIINWGPSLDYRRDKATYSVGFFENFNFKNMFKEFQHFIFPSASAYYNPSTALSLGTRISYNVDPQNNYSYLSALAELVYRFGSRVQDTLFTSFASSGRITGLVYVDENDNGEYEPTEKLVQNISITINAKQAVFSKDGKFEFSAQPGDNEIAIVLPKEYQNYQFTASNPETVGIYNGETKTVNFGINRRVSVFGKVVVRDKNDVGFGGAKIEISGPNYVNIVETTPAGVFNTTVPNPGKYKAKLLVLDLPTGYKSVGSTSMEFTAVEDQVNKLETIVLNAKRIISGRVFIDQNSNGAFDENDVPLGRIIIQIGNISVQSETDGSFSISTLPSGIYNVKVSPMIFKGMRANLINDKISVPEAGIVQFPISYTK